MKKIKLLFSLLVLSLGLVLTNCTSDDPIYVAGQDGIDGVDGIDGADGSALVCIECHSNTHREPIYNSYELSFHSKGVTEGAVEYAGARASCAQCHSHEGFTDFQDLGTTNPAGYYGLGDPVLVLVTNDNGTPDDESDDFEEPELDEYGLPVYENEVSPVVSAISCDTCHGTHISFDFENDGNDYALRALTPEPLITDGTVIDYGGNSNMCITCHQPRRTGPTDNGTGMFRVTSSHWGPHHGPQATLLEGIQGAEIGTVAYPAIGSAKHRTGSSCVACHMAETTDGSDGLHSMIPNDNCTTVCHGSGQNIPTEVGGLAADMATLATLLETVGVVHDDHPVPGMYTVEEAQAAWNYLLVLEDASNGIHNPKYAKALIAGSIEVLTN